MRWKALGLSMALYMVGATGCGLSKAPDAADASAVKAKIEWRLASHAPSAGYAEAAYQGRPVYLAPQALLAVEEGATVSRVDGDDGRPALDLRVAGHGERLTRATEQNIGKPIALLADGQVLTVATVMAPLSGESLRISGLQDVQEQQRVFALLTHASTAAAPAQAGKR
ncbi:preprotein translocase subunit SecD [Xanthomonas sp. AM6]|uniref:SecDF P1 head subdomain-containing protein n=1 Tax=Xanthomonas sp. AM6 TaxID=2982531 RepID=UPI0021DA45F0|nr:preprotein translocase subunit SecD [Xanthomonas sp. AM6]UYB52785.1 preprotein translocase subunit SecD [Xanthomonas sp. AM6]